ncbi:hypothetical protein C4J84_2728 [Pseudomonas sp. R11-23-07]|nr:hypothetical protein C4J91_3020 [Pseudomonas sp. R3-52-08]AZF48098.1 hypothetical protein C4J86_2865 [Pseudomonas sp. R2-7-07]AZF58603.1 hypothetical protein C4J84_2728 [Pseudomonas sp. R11-23-07]
MPARPDLLSSYPHLDNNPLLTNHPSYGAIVFNPHSPQGLY